PGAPSRVDFLLSDPADYLSRVEIAFPLVNLRFGEANLVGQGLGKFGQETNLNLAIQARGYVFLMQYFHPNHAYDAATIYADAGLTKVTIELGVLGLALYLIYLGSLVAFVVACVRLSIAAQDEALLFFGLIPACWVVYFL